MKRTAKIIERLLLAAPFLLTVALLLSLPSKLSAALAVAVLVTCCAALFAIAFSQS